MGLDRCRLIKYSGLSDGTRTDLGLYRKLFFIVPVLGTVQLIRGIHTILVSHHLTMCSFRAIRIPFFFLVSSLLKNLTEYETGPGPQQLMYR